MCVGDEFDQVPWEQVAGRDMHQRAYDAMMARIAAGETVEVEHDPRLSDSACSDEPKPLGNGWTLVWHADFRLFGRRWFVSIERKP
jgi:hypothetical protein